MRIVAGEFKGRRIVAPEGRGIRPTLEIVREAVFDSLGARVRGARALDLFAGCGAMGLEALSRGAAHVTWCDIEPRSLAAVRENIQKLGVAPSRCAVHHVAALTAIRRFEKSGQLFDIVFVDPPYEDGLYDETMLALAMNRLVLPGGVVVVEHGKRIEPEPTYGDLTRDRTRRYGESRISYYFRNEERSPEPTPAENVP